MGSLDLGQWLLLAFFAGLAYLALKPRKGAPAVCKACGHHGPSRAHTRGSGWIELVLWLCLIVPGLIYSLWRLSTRRPACEACQSTELVPPDSPVGRRLLREMAEK
jgi:hypothetical protein